VASGRCDELRRDELFRKALALFSRQQLLQSGHILVFFMFNVVMEILQKMIEGGVELAVIGRHVLKFVEIFFDLFRLSMVLLSEWCQLLQLDAGRDRRWSDLYPLGRGASPWLGTWLIPH